MIKDKKVFISATYIDLKDERICAMETVLQSGNVAYGMELFPSSSDGVVKIIEKQIDECDIYILIIGNRYGSIHVESGNSYTEWEYQLALQKGKRVLPFIKEDITKILDPVNQQKFDNFKAKVGLNHSPSYFSTPIKLKDKLWSSLDAISTPNFSVEPSQRIAIQVMNCIHPAFYHQIYSNSSGFNPNLPLSEHSYIVDEKQNLWDYWEKYFASNVYSRKGFEHVVKMLAEYDYNEEADCFDAIHDQSMHELKEIFCSIEILDKSYNPTEFGVELGMYKLSVMKDFRRRGC